MMLSMRHSGGLSGGIVISAALLLACCAPATAARVSSGLLADLPVDVRKAVETASTAAEGVSRRLQQEATTARLLPPNQVSFVVSCYGSRQKSLVCSPLQCMPVLFGYSGCQLAGSAATQSILERHV
jgi:hypothetical protein